MILYTNGGEHTVAARAVNEYSYANDDIRYVAQGRRPHPDNLAVSWSMDLSRMLNLGLACDAEAGSSVDRIIRTTDQFLEHRKSMRLPYTVVVIGWTTWDREEWYDDDSKEWLQVSAAHSRGVPDKWKMRHRQWAAGLDYQLRETQAHEKIHGLHGKLRELGIPHLFFNAMWHFSGYQDSNTDWHGCYVDPYDIEMCMSDWLVAKKMSQSNLGPEAHRLWAELLFSRLTPLLLSV